MKSAMPILVIFCALLPLVSCAARNEIVLLPGPEDKPTRIIVSNKGGTQVLSVPYQATSIRTQTDAPSPPYQMTADKIRETYGDAIAALPVPPVHFLLYFKAGTTDLTDESRKLLEEVLSTSLSRKSTDMSVVGHTDRVGSRENNFKLALGRAELVKQVLVSQGIDPDFIDATSHGEDNPLIKTDDEVSEQRNRRVEVVIR